MHSFEHVDASGHVPHKPAEPLQQAAPLHRAARHDAPPPAHQSVELQRLRGGAAEGRRRRVSGVRLRQQEEQRSWRRLGSAAACFHATPPTQLDSRTAAPARPPQTCLSYRVRCQRPRHVLLVGHDEQRGARQPLLLQQAPQLLCGQTGGGAGRGRDVGCRLMQATTALGAMLGAVLGAVLDAVLGATLLLPQQQPQLRQAGRRVGRQAGGGDGCHLAATNYKRAHCQIAAPANTRVPACCMVPFSCRRPRTAAAAQHPTLRSLPGRFAWRPPARAHPPLRSLPGRIARRPRRAQHPPLRSLPGGGGLWSPPPTPARPSAQSSCASRGAASSARPRPTRSAGSCVQKEGGGRGGAQGSGWAARGGAGSGCAGSAFCPPTSHTFSWWLRY